MKSQNIAMYFRNYYMQKLRLEDKIDENGEKVQIDATFFLKGLEIKYIVVENDIESIDQT